MRPVIHVWGFEENILGFHAEFRELPAAVTFAQSGRSAADIVRIDIEDQQRNRRTTMKRVEGRPEIGWRTLPDEPIEEDQPMVA